MSSAYDVDALFLVLRNLCGCPRTKRGKKYHSSDRATKKERRKEKKEKKRGERVSEAGLASSSFLSAAALKDRGIKADLWTFI